MFVPLERTLDDDLQSARLMMVLLSPDGVMVAEVEVAVDSLGDGKTEMRRSDDAWHYQG